MVAQMVIEGVIPRTEDPNGLVSPGIIAQARNAARWKAEHMGLWWEMVERARRCVDDGRRCSGGGHLQAQGRADRGDA